LEQAALRSIMIFKTSANALEVTAWMQANNYKCTLMGQSVTHPTLFVPISAWKVPDEEAQVAFKLKWKTI